MAKIQKIDSRAYGCVRMALVADTRYTSSDGRHAIAVRVTYNYKRKYIRTGIELTDADYQRMLSATKGRWADVRKDAVRVLDLVYAQVRERVDAGTFSIDAISLARPTARTITQMAECKGGVAYKTQRMYGNAVAAFVRAVGDVPMTSVTQDAVERFAARMQRDGMSKATQSMYLRCIRSLCNMAIADGDMTDYPFRRGAYGKGAKVPSGSKRTGRFLSVAQILDIDAMEMTEAQREAWDVWMLSYLCGGANVADIARWRAPAGGVIEYSRSKTSSDTIVVALCERAQRIVEGRTGVLFPWMLQGVTDEVAVSKRIDMSTAYLNRRLKTLREGLTMTYARHSFRTNAMRKGVPDRFIEYAMGHAQRDVASYYAGGYTLKQMRAWLSSLLEDDGD